MHGHAERVDALGRNGARASPANAPVFRSEKAEALASLAEGWEKGVRPSSEQIAGWSPSETLVYLQKLPRKMSAAIMSW